MAKTVRDSKLETKAARERLAAGETIYWRTLEPGRLHLGYRRRSAGLPGHWIARLYVGLVKNEKTGKDVGRYKKHTLGLADDFRDADGRGVLSFAEAQRMAYDRADKADAPPAPELPPVPTIRELVEDYLRFLAAEKKTATDARRRANTHILPELGDLRADALTTPRLVKWRDDMATAPARLRSKKDGEQRYRPAPATDDQRRARRATVNRTVTVLKAALNRAVESGILAEDTAWDRLKPFGNVDSRRPGHLSVPEAQRLLNAADAASGFRDLVRAALLTGCRYGELCRLSVADFQRGRIVVRESKSGRARDIRLTDEAVAFFKSLAAGREPSVPLLPRADGGRWGPSHQSRPMLEACAGARIEPAVGFHQLRHTWASLSVMAGMPLMMVAENLGHADTRMVEKHYGHLTEDYRDDMIKKYAPRFDIVADAAAPVDLAERRRAAQ